MNSTIEPLSGNLDFSRIQRMPFSIKSEHADELLSEVRDLTGEGITEAIIRALEVRLAELKRHPRADADQIRHLSRTMRRKFDIPTWQPEETELSESHGLLLYGDDGLPR